jgi:hypothetical protein
MLFLAEDALHDQHMTINFLLLKDAPHIAVAVYLLPLQLSSTFTD